MRMASLVANCRNIQIFNMLLNPHISFVYFNLYPVSSKRRYMDCIENTPKFFHLHKGLLAESTRVLTSLSILYCALFVIPQFSESLVGKRKCTNCFNVNNL